MSKRQKDVFSRLKYFNIKCLNESLSHRKIEKSAFKRSYLRTSEKTRHQIANTSEFDVPDIFYSINLFNYGATYLLEGIWQALQSIKEFTRDMWDFMKTVRTYVISLRGLAKGIATMKHWLKSYLGPL